MSNAVKVAVRARPLSERELKTDSKITMEMSGNTVRLYDPKGRASTGGAGPVIQGTKSFAYDYCYWSTQRDDSNFASQEKVFSDLGVLLVENAVAGYNASAMAYGQTGSGKTHTMMGTNREPGLVPRLCQALYDHIGANKDPKVSFRTEVSYMEIYNEHVGDLLAPSNRKKTQHNLRVREDPRSGPYVQGLSWHVVTDRDAMIERMNVGNSIRTTASTLMNDTSSRSHAIFTIKFTHACFSADRPQETVSRINLVDLAGSERAKSTGATGGRLKEGSNINKSLVALGNVISALAEKSHVSSGRAKKVFTPYRDSMLTWLLKDSLGGNSRTIMVATVSPAEINYGETLSTLRYASRAKDIVNQAVVNEDSNVRLIRELRAEISRLKVLLSASPNVNLTPAGLSTAATVSQELAKNERLAEQLTQQWAGRWEETRQLAQGRKVAVKGEGVSVVLNAESPHFVAISDDPLSTGIKLYYLEEGTTTMGTQAASVDGKPFDIELLSPTNSRIFVDVINTSGSVVVRLVEGACFLNGLPVSGEAELHQGQILLIGENNLFRFQNPIEAAQMRKDMRERGVQPTSGFNTPSVLYAPMIESQRRTAREAEEVAHDIDTSPEHTARSFTPDSGNGSRPLFNPAEVAAKLATVRQYESDDSAGALSLMSPPDSGPGDSGITLMTTSPSGSHQVLQQRIPSSTGGTPQKPLATLPEETYSGATSPIKATAPRLGDPLDPLGTAKSNKRNNAPSGHPGQESVIVQKLESQHSERMRQASRQWEEEKALLLNEIRRIQSSPQPSRAEGSAQENKRKPLRRMAATSSAGSKSRAHASTHGALPGKTIRAFGWSDSSPPSVNSDSSSSSDPPSGSESTLDTVEYISSPTSVTTVTSPPSSASDRARLLSGSHSHGSAAWSSLRGQNNSMEVDLILDALDYDSSAVPTTDDLKRLSSAHRRQAQKFATNLRSLSTEKSTHSHGDLLSVQHAQHQQLARMAEVHQQLQMRLVEKKHGWEKISSLQLEQLASDRDSLNMQLNDLQEIIETQRVTLDNFAGGGNIVQQFASFKVSIDIPSVTRRGKGADLTVYYQVVIDVEALQWCTERSYAAFRTFHDLMMQDEHLPATAAGLFPPFKWYNTKGKAFVEKRRQQLKTYLRHVLVHLSNTHTHTWHLANSAQHLKELVCGQLPFFDPTSCTV